jgi:hypothetical protein
MIECRLPMQDGHVSVEEKNTIGSSGAPDKQYARKLNYRLRPE